MQLVTTLGKAQHESPLVWSFGDEGSYPIGSTISVGKTLLTHFFQMTSSAIMLFAVETLLKNL